MPPISVRGASIARKKAVAKAGPKLIFPREGTVARPLYNLVANQLTTI